MSARVNYSSLTGLVKEDIFPHMLESTTFDQKAWEEEQAELKLKQEKFAKAVAEKMGFISDRLLEMPEFLEAWGNNFFTRPQTSGRPNRVYFSRSGSRYSVDANNENHGGTLSLNPHTKTLDIDRDGVKLKMSSYTLYYGFKTHFHQGLIGITSGDQTDAETRINLTGEDALNRIDEFFPEFAISEQPTS